MERRPTRRSDLTERQREVLALIAAGKTNGEIADALGISLDGAKYHVREIMGRLGVDSREEAAEWWRAGRPRLPLPSLGRAFAGPLWAWLGGGVAVVAVTAGVVAFELSGSSAQQLSPADATVRSATATATKTVPGLVAAPLSPTASPAVTPADVSLPRQEPAWVLSNGTPVDYDTCLSITDWTHLTFDEMLGPEGSYARVRLLGLRNSLSASYYALFLSKFFYNTFATASSGQIEPSMLLGIGHVGPGPTIRNGGDCSAWDNRWGANTLELDLANYTVVDLRSNGLQLVARVSRSRDTFQTIAFGAPVPGVGLPQKDPGGNGMRPYAEVDVVSEDGALLFQSFGAFNSVQYSDSGSLVFAMLEQSAAQTATTTVHITEVANYLLYNDPSANTGSYTADFAIHPVGGNADHHLSVHAPQRPWAPVAAIALQPGDYELTITGGSGDYLLLPASTPPPAIP